MSDPGSQWRGTTPGRHLCADLYGVKPQLLTSETLLLDLLLRSVRAAGFNVVGQLSRKFPGEQSGVIAVALL
jgi:S-adenosylmethionine/arginine decarboxylase-like enzyme